MLLKKDQDFTLLRVSVASGWLLLCLLIIAAPLIAFQESYAASSIFYFMFSSVCHQIPERSFSIAGFPFAVCHRCLGIYLGLAAGSLIASFPGIFRMRRTWVAAATLPLLLDVAVPLTGLGNNTSSSRFCTGLLFGFMLATIFMQGILDLVYKVRCQRLLCKGEAL